MIRRIYAARIALTELDGIHERVGRAKIGVSALLATKGKFAGRIDAEMKHELERIQGLLARVQDELKALRDRSDSGL
jgi:hypothetical protein